MVLAMCLAIEGRILEIHDQAPTVAPGGCNEVADSLWWVADVDFGGVRQAVSLACLPQAQVGDRVLVHVGLAIALVQDVELHLESDSEFESESDSDSDAHAVDDHDGEPTIGV